MINAVDVLCEAERLGVTVEPRGDGLAYRGLRSVLSPEFIESLRNHKTEILPILREKQASVEMLLGWASWVSESELVLQEPLNFSETSLRPVVITDVSQYALRQLKLITQCRIQQGLGGQPGFNRCWWREREEEALSALDSLKKAMECGSS